jgi:hypothetical protein
VPTKKGVPGCPSIAGRAYLARVRSNRYFTCGSAGFAAYEIARNLLGLKTQVSSKRTSSA